MKKIYLLILLMVASNCITAQTLQWAKQLSGTNDEFGYSITVDASGNVYTTGAFQGTVDFNPGAATVNLTALGGYDIFVSKLDAAGNFVWAKQLGGTSEDISHSIAVDAAGNVYTTGEFQGTADFEPGAATFNLTSAGLDDIFISKLDAAGNFVWAVRFGGTAGEAGLDIALDAAANVYTTGAFRATIDFDPGAATVNLTTAGLDDIFISKLDAAGNFIYARQLGGTTNDVAYSITVDAATNVYTTGGFQGTADFNPGAATVNLISFGLRDIFVSKLDAAGNFVYAKQLGGTGTESGNSITVDATGNVYTAGDFSGTADFDPGPAAFNLTSVGLADIFVSKLDATGNFVWAKGMGGTGIDIASAVAVDATGNVYTNGGFEFTVDFDPGAPIVNLTSLGFEEVFISKLDAAGNYVWAVRLGGTDGEVATAIALDAMGNIYSTGGFEGTCDFDPGAVTFNLTALGITDAFVHKMSQAIADPPPTVTINQAAAQADPTGTSPINFTVVFNETVTGFATGDVTLSGTAGATTATVTGSGTTYNVAVSGMTANGTVIATIAAGVANDAGGNPNTASTSTDNTVTYNNIVPSLNLQWVKQFAGSLSSGYSITQDASGNVYTTGRFGGTVDFDPGAATFNLTSAGNIDIFISKLDAAGNFVWAKRFGGSDLDDGVSIAVDASGNVYTSGFFRGTADFDPGAGTFNLTSAGSNDIFISKLDAAGNFVYAKQLGGTGIDTGISIALDASGNVLTTGYFNATVDFDPGTGTFNLTSAGVDDIFISKLDAAGNFVWAKKMGGISGDIAYSIALDASGNIYTTGHFGATADFDPGTGTFNLTAAGGLDIFVSKLDAAGNFVWARQLGEVGQDDGRSIALDASGNVYTTGLFSGTADFDPGAATFNLTSAGNFDIFISKLDAAGNFIWAKGMGGVSQDVGYSITLDASGNIYTTGHFGATADFDPGTGTFNLTSAGSVDIFISKLDGTGSFVYAKQLGGTSVDNAYAITLDASGNIYTTGEFSGTADFNPDLCVFNLTGNDAFVHKMGPAPDPPPTVTINQAAAQPDPTANSPVNFTVVFNEPVTGFATGDVTLSGTAGATTATVTGSGTTYNVAVSGMTANGTVITTIAAGVATDAGCNPNPASTSTDNTVTYTVGDPPPTVTINQAAGQADPTGTSPINFTVVFNETVTGFATGDVTLSGTAGATTATVTGTGTTYNVAVSGMTANGTVIATIAAGVANDAGGNPNVASTSTDNTVTYTGIADPPPTVTINQAAAQADPTGTSPINFTVVFNETVTGFATGDVTLSGTAGATTATVTGSGTTYNVAVSGMTANGTVIATIAAGVAIDAGGNPNLASTSTDNTVTYTGIADPPPTVTINQAAAQADPTGTSPINFTVVFNETVTGFATGDVTLAGTAGATTATVTGSGTTYNVAVSGMTANGTVIATIAAGVAIDAGGNPNLASTSTDNTVTYTGIADPPPTVTINQAAAQADPTGTSPINFTVVFNETVTGFATGDVTLSGTAGATTATVTGSGTTYNVAVSGMTANGTVIATIAAGVANDAGGNPNTASTSTDNTVTYTGIVDPPPTVTINQAAAQADPTATSPINFTVVFNETVTGFATGDVTLSGTAGATTATVTGSGTTYNVAVSGMTANGTVIGTIAAGVANDAGGNPNLASTSTDNTVQFNLAACTIITAQPSNRSVCANSNAAFSVSATNAVSYQWQVNTGSGFSNISGATAATLTLNNVTTSMSGNQYRVIVTGACTSTSNSAVLTVYSLPVVTLNLNIDSIYLNSAIQTLSGGLPVGGVFSGPGVGNGIINPSAFQTGNYTVLYSYTDANGCSNPATDRFTILPKAMMVNVYPTPAENGAVKILVAPEMAGAFVTAYTATGQKIRGWTLSGQLNTYTFPWPAGIYSLEFIKGSLREVKTIVIVR